MTTPEQSQQNSLEYEDLPTDYEIYREGERLACAVEATLKMISGRWKVLIFRELLPETKRFNELQRSLRGITHKMLTQQLREMERDGIVHRETYQQSPKVEYSLTSLGKTLHPIIDVTHKWGVEYLKNK